MAESTISIEIDGSKVFKFTETQALSTPNTGDFPGNQADPQYAAKDAEIDQAKYGCSYTGRHDHGQLPPQTRGSPHEDTLRFLEQARKVVGEELNNLVKAAKPMPQ